jgi:DNA polymerase III sliding clamp (beta) subunit (PCNA family)
VGLVKFSCSAAELKEAWSFLSYAFPKSVLDARVNVTISGDHMELRTRNDGTAVRRLVSVTRTSKDDAEFSLPAYSAKATLGAIPKGAETVEVSVAKRSISLAAGRFKAKLPQLATEPVEMPLPTSEPIPVQGEDFRAAVKAVAAAVNPSNPKMVFTGVLLDVTKTGITLIGTDGYQFAIAGTMTQDPNREEGTYNVPLAALQAAASDERVDSVSICAERHKVSFHLDDSTILTTLIEGIYPWRKATEMAAKATGGAQLDRAALLEAVRAVSTVGGNIVKLRFAFEELTVEAAEEAQATCTIPISDGENHTGVLWVGSAGYIQHALSVVSNPTILFTFGHEQPGTFRHPDPAVSAPTFIISPIRGQK